MQPYREEKTASQMNKTAIATGIVGVTSIAGVFYITKQLADLNKKLTELSTTIVKLNERIEELEYIVDDAGLTNTQSSPRTTATSYNNYNRVAHTNYENNRETRAAPYRNHDGHTVPANIQPSLNNTNDYRASEISTISQPIIRNNQQVPPTFDRVPSRSTSLPTIVEKSERELISEIEDDIY